MLAMRTGEVYVQRQLGNDPSEELREVQRQTEARLIVLRMRAFFDAQVRDAVDHYLQATRVVIMPGADKGERELTLLDTMKPFNAPIDRIAEVLRSL